MKLRGIAFLAGLVILATQFGTNFLGTAPRALFAGFQADSADLVVRRIDASHDAGSLTRGGFLLHPDGPYFSQSGLQGRVFSLLAIVWPYSRSALFDFLRWLCAVLAAVVFMIWIHALSRDLGWAAGIAWLLVLGSSWIVLFAPNIYWIVFSHFLPMVAVWWLLSRPRGVSPRMLYATYGLLVMFKCLSGYEFLSNILLSGIPVLYYFSSRAGETRATLVRRAALLIASGVLGFVLAAGVHVYQMRLFTGSWTAGIDAIAERASARTFGATGFGHAPADSNVVTIALRYARIPVFIIPMPGPRDVAIPLYAVGMIWLLSLVPSFGRRSTDSARRLATASILGFLATMSWVVLAKGHMFHHLHLNGIIFYLPWLLTAYAYWAHLLANRYSAAPVPPPGPSAAPASESR